MENYSYATSYPDSGDSSPRSREIDFENPSPWDDQSQPPSNYKVKFMCSYGGKIHPRPNDNQLSYLGGETKILAVDRNIKFSGIISKLSAFCDTEVCFKYQLPGEDLDALISVTNDDDLEHMMHEYDRLYRATAKPARLRLFVFAVNRSESEDSGSSEAKTDRERFVEALNSGPTQSVEGASPLATVPQNNVDFLFGLDKGVPPPQPAKLQDPVQEPNIPVGAGLGGEDRVSGSDLEIHRRIQELQRLQIGGNEQAMYRPKNDDNLVGAYAGDFYAPKYQERAPPANLPANVASTVSVPTGYWSENQMAGGGFQATMSTTPVTEQQQVYMYPAPTGVYHTQMVRQVTGQGGQGYYAVQRMGPDVYRDQPVYNVPPQAAAPPSLPPKMTAYTEGIGMMRASGGGGGGGGVADTGYAQVGYDSAGRQVYYTSPGGVMPQYQGIAAVSAEMRPAVAYSQESKVVTKASQANV